MFKGYAAYGGGELINVARLVKYAAEGGVPDGVRVDPMVGDYGDLAAALGDPAYRTALLDSPPWLDDTNPDSAQFAGLLPLEITNLDGSTKGRTITESLGDGGRAGTARASSRTIGVTVLALAANDAALDAGLSWLAGALHPPCAGPVQACSGGALDLFSSAPVYCDNLPNEDADPVTIDLIGVPMEVPGPSLAYSSIFGDLLDPICSEVTVTAQVGLGELEEGQDPFGRLVVLELVDSTGTLYAASAAVELPPDGSLVEVTVTATPSPGSPNEWEPILRWYGPAIISGGDAYTTVLDGLRGGGADPEAPDLLMGGDADGPWSIGAAWGGNLVVATWTLTRLPLLTIDDCLGDLRRSYRNVVTVAGPTVVEELTLENGERYAAKVEWTWVATDPVAYGDTTDLLRGLLVGRPGGGNPAAVVASTENLPLFVPVTGLYNIDGMSADPSNPAFFTNRLYPGDRVLLKDQTDQAENGIYTYIGGGSYFVRVADLDTWAEAETGMVYITGGSTQSGTYWVTDVGGGGTINVTDMPWEPGSPPVTGYDEGVTYRGEGIQIADNEEVTGASTGCPLPAPVTTLCGDDPDLPVLLLPPTPPSMPDPGMPVVADYVRREFQVPPDLSPQPGGLLNVVIANLGDEAYRGIRVRLWADEDPDFGVVEECEFEQEFYLAYLSPEQTVTIAGPDHRVTTTCVEGIDADHERNMRGAYGGPFVFPQFSCGSRYHVAIDVPVTEDAGGISVDLSITRRSA